MEALLLALAVPTRKYLLLTCVSGPNSAIMPEPDQIKIPNDEEYKRMADAASASRERRKKAERDRIAKEGQYATVFKALELITSANKIEAVHSVGMSQAPPPPGQNLLSLLFVTLFPCWLSNPLLGTITRLSCKGNHPRHAHISQSGLWCAAGTSHTRFPHPESIQAMLLRSDVCRAVPNRESQPGQKK